MPPKKGILSGSKINNNHSTYIPLAGKVISRLKREVLVKKIVLGPIKPIKNGPRRLSVKDLKGQVCIKCRETQSIQTLWVIGVDANVLIVVLGGIIKKL